MKLSSLTTLKAGMLMYVCFPHELEHGGSQLLWHHLALAWSETVGAQDLSCRRKIDPKYSPILPSQIIIPHHQAHNRNTQRALCPTGTSASCSSSEQCCPHCNCSVLALVWSSTLPSSSFLQTGSESWKGNSISPTVRSQFQVHVGLP